ncbi:alanyl-tRNA synthetase [Paenibacillus alvei TS-15]|uniref:Alanine--tRNA ligase n=1 Tax=Paenibacillus alvei TS-15 TaxID=1117108 RepID=S9TV51_PAEAL|nr:alanine--tRNA ligase [Paenibacillus alvei]EPY06141.1 alanyl-tRNA synthetase [Paenibacillus alvei TS-15]
MKASEIREKWLKFFESKGHHIEPSASLVPHNDPSLLWINAGMAPLKPYFDGRVKPENPRIANSQKCIRTNDIENVGKTRRHHTFFEMLGNFSIGDYFKEEAITWAWEFLTSKEWIGFDPNRLYVTVHNDDEEAYKLWNEKIGLPADHIVKTGDDNFWDIGEGPCGPCTEIFYDRGEKYGTLEEDPECYPSGENERYLEVWNNVFSQYNHNKDGSYTPLPNKNIDTGAGLERFASILQDVDSNFDTDLFQPIIQATCRIAGVKYNERPELDVALKVIADHVRTVTFAVGDGVLPSNEGRGYVIRRLLRRAVRYGKILGIDRPFMVELVQTVCEVMGSHYNEIVEKREFIEKVIKNEEERFHETLVEGLAILESLASAAKQEGRTQIGGQEAFKLYDTYGFPFDLTEDYASEHGLTVDREGFDQAMQEQRDRARAARQDTGSMKVQGGPLADYTTKSEFVGYNELVTESSVLALIVDNEMQEEAQVGTTCQVVLDRTPFYAESGGQVSDSGVLTAAGFKGAVEDVWKAPHGQHIAVVRVEEGTLRVGMQVQAAVARAIREDIIKNHTATHLLHKALKLVLGEHANQAGSLVQPDRLRFDFTHLGSISEEELVDIEHRVNEQIWKGTQLVIESKSIDEAKEMGAMALFGEKYGDVVRVVQVGDYSIELCGGCHVSSTSEIGLFKIVSESGIGSGVRRIEAVTGRHAYQYMEAQLELLKQAGSLLKSNVADVPKRIEAMFSREKELSRENESLKSKLSSIEAGQLTDQVRTVAGVQVLAAQVDAGGMDALRTTADELKAKLPEAIIALGAVNEDKVNFVVAVAPELVKKGLHAGKLIKELASVCGGGGGGRPDMAQAGGKDASKLPEALALVDELVGKQLGV